MEESQRLDDTLRNESVLDLDIASFDWENLHNDFQFSTKAIEDALNGNSKENAEKSLNFESCDFSWFGNCNKPFGGKIDSARENIGSDSEELANGLHVSSFINNPGAPSLKKVIETPFYFTENLLADENNGQIEVNDSDFDIPKFDHVQDCTTSPKRRKFTDNFERTDEIDGVVESFGVKIYEEKDKCKTPKNRSLESAHFEATKKQFGSASVRSPVAEVGSLSSMNTRKYFSDKDLLTLDTKELNKRVRSLPKCAVDEIKQRRRTLKNRGYARLCRDKKNDETKNLKEIKGSLEKEVASKRLELAVITMERDEWKQKFQKLALVVSKLLGIEVKLLHQQQ